MKVQDILFEQMYRNNEARLNRLKNNLEREDSESEWALCLGAGISISAGLPDWYGLLAKMTAQIIPDEMMFELQNNTRACQLDASGYDRTESDPKTDDEAFQADVQRFFEELNAAGGKTEYLEKLESAQNGKYKYVFANINVLESAEYIRNYIAHLLQPENNSKESKETAERNINWHINYFIHQSCLQSLKYSMDSEKMKKSALGAAARLLKSDKDSIIHDVITYNYDNLLEEYLRTNCGCDAAKIHSVIKTDVLPRFGDQGAWNIYHVHGRIPVFECESEPMSEEVILTESDYYKEERINYSWTNTIQSYILGRANVIFVGFSGTDYNFRRLLKYIRQDKSNAHKRYIFFSVDDIVNAVFGNRENIDDSVSQCIKKMNQNEGSYAYEKLMINYLIHAQTLYWYKNGMEVIWTSHEELPYNLDRMHL